MSKGKDNVRERHKSLYFMDGNVVILAPQKDKSELLFRVHKSVLSSHSPIFSDMFQVCSPSGCTSETESEADHFYDGVPLVRVSDDSDHLASVLEVLYYQSDLPWVHRSPHYPALVMPILDISRKYGIDRMYAQIMRHLECDWPQTLKDWDTLERDIKSPITNNSESDVERIDDHFPEPAAAIKLARQFDVPSILPAAFYHLSRLSILDDWDKTHTDPSILVDTQNRTKRTARWQLLSAEDFRCLLLGKAKLAEFLRGRIDSGDLRYTHLNGKREYCGVGEALWKDILDKCSQSADPLALLKIWIEVDKAPRCLICMKALEAKMTALRTQIWDELGNLFHPKGDRGRKQLPGAQQVEG